MQNTLLVGNGVNRVGTTGPSWAELLQELASTLNMPGTTGLSEKPFPLFFDYLALTGRQFGFRSSKQIKSMVAEQIGKLQPGVYHRRLMNLGAKHVLTTNYDDTLERASGGRSFPPSDEISPKYNLFRRRSVGSTTVWYLHGVSSQPESIVLGYDHYAGSIERMRGYMKREYHGIHSPFKKGVKHFEDGVFSWLDIFLRDNIHIVGLTLDYVEVDLWWIIYYKASLRSRGKDVGATHFYAFVGRDYNTTDEARCDLLTALGVIVHRIPVASTIGYELAWDVLLQELEQEFGGIAGQDVVD